MTYGAHDALSDTIVDLRGHTALTNLLDDPTAITEGWPKDGQDYPAVVRVQPITEASSHHHKTTRRTFRFQFSVVVTQGWRDDQSAPTYRMAEIMHEVAERMDVGAPIEGMLPEGAESGSWQEVTGGRLALIQDWLITTQEVR